MNDPLLMPRLDNFDVSSERLHGAISEIEQTLKTLATNDKRIQETLAQVLLLIAQMQARNDQLQAELLEKLRNELRHSTQTSVENSIPAPAPLVQPPPVETADSYLIQNPDVALLQEICSWVPSAIALDIGANKGEVSEKLLEAGYEVYAFEPNPVIYPGLVTRFSIEPRFHPFQLALGASEQNLDLHLANDLTGSKKYGDPSLYSSLIVHPMPADMPFNQTISVKVCPLESLRRMSKIPTYVGVIKIDAEGYDLEILKGLGEVQSPVIMTEFWDNSYAFGRSGKGHLGETVSYLKGMGYHWFIVIYHLDSGDKKPVIGYFCNRVQTVPNSWGNAIFFRDHGLFLNAWRWCDQRQRQRDAGPINGDSSLETKQTYGLQ